MKIQNKCLNATISDNGLIGVSGNTITTGDGTIDIDTWAPVCTSDGTEIQFTHNEYGVGIRGSFRISGVHNQMQELLMPPSFSNRNGFYSQYSMRWGGVSGTSYNLVPPFGIKTMTSVSNMLSHWKMIRFMKNPLKLLADMNLPQLIYNTHQSSVAELVLFNKPRPLEYLLAWADVKKNCLCRFSSWGYWTVGYHVELPGRITLFQLQKSTGAFQQIMFSNVCIPGEDYSNWECALEMLVNQGTKVVAWGSD